MASTICPYDVGSPSIWLANAGYEYNRKACRVPLGLDCGMNSRIIADCCPTALQSQSRNTSEGCSAYISGDGYTATLPEDATNTTFQRFQDCILNYPGRDGGFRCNDLGASNRGPNCNSRTGAISPPVNPPKGQQACVTGAVANASALMERCCGSPAIAFEGGCWMYCVGPANQSIGRCIQDGLSQVNSTGNVGCLNGTADVGVSSGCRETRKARGFASTLALIVVVVCAVGLL